MNHCAAYQRGNGGNAMDNSQNRKILVAYFSAQGATARAARAVAQAVGGTLFEIRPKEPYTDAISTGSIPKAA